MMNSRDKLNDVIAKECKFCHFNKNHEAINGLWVNGEVGMMILELTDKNEFLVKPFGKTMPVKFCPMCGRRLD